MSVNLDSLSVRGKDAYVEFNAPRDGICREYESASRAHAGHLGLDILLLLVPTYWVNL